MCIRDSHFTSYWFESSLDGIKYSRINTQPYIQMIDKNLNICLLYTSDAADERSSVDLGGRRIIKKKK